MTKSEKALLKLLLSGRAEVEKKIAEEFERVERKSWADFYGQRTQADIQFLMELRREDGSYVVNRDADDVEHDIARSCWRAREGLFGITKHGPIDIVENKTDDWWSRER